MNNVAEFQDIHNVTTNQILNLGFTAGQPD